MKNELSRQYKPFFHLFDSDPQNISFHFLIPEGINDKAPYYKLKVVLPDSDLSVTRWANKLKHPCIVSNHCGNTHTCPLQSEGNQGQAKCCHSRRKFPLVIPQWIVTPPYGKISVVQEEISLYLCRLHHKGIGHNFIHLLKQSVTGLIENIVELVR